MIDTALLLAAPLVVGMMAGWLLGGRLSTLARVRLRALWLLWVAAAVQVIQLFVEPVTKFVEDRLHVPTLAAVFGCVATWLILNLRGQRLAVQLAVAVIFMGGALNALTIAMNEGRMPYESAAAVRVGLPAALETRKNAPADSATVFSDLGDVIAIPLIHKVVSLGDLMIGAGVVAMIVAMMRSTGRLAGATSDAQEVLAHGAASLGEDGRGEQSHEQASEERHPDTRHIGDVAADRGCAADDQHELSRATGSRGWPPPHRFTSLSKTTARR